MKQKIAILTQPLHNNYGGLLQNFALQTVLKNAGHEVTTVDFSTRKNSYAEAKEILKRTVKKYALGRRNVRIFRQKKLASDMKIVGQHTNEFKYKNISLSEHISSVKNIEQLNKYQFDAYVVGSDQVWRPCYSPNLPTFFLDFLKGDKQVKKIAYAASFGVDNWEFTKEQTLKSRQLIQEFDAVSVREDSAVQLCKDYLEAEAQQVVDPTLLLEKEVYESLIPKYKVDKNRKYMLVYILDNSEEKKAIVNKTAKELGLEVVSVMPTTKYHLDKTENIEEAIFPPVAEWIKGFKDAEFVLTDSFHGTAFSIIFNKPFIAIGNKGRGLSRFNSILKLFGLEDRLIFSAAEIDKKKIIAEINWEGVRTVLEKERNKSVDFLKMAMTGSAR